MGAIELMPNMWLTKGSVRRLLVSHIAAEQSPRIRNLSISSDLDVSRLVNAARTSDDVDRLKVDEATMGFDSLAMLDLVLRLNVFFGLHRSGIEDYLLVQREIGDWIELLSRHYDHLKGDVSLTFSTSGSTGPKRRVEHRLKDLDRELNSHKAAWLDHAMRPSQIVTLVPPTHIYGFIFSCLLPDRLGVEVVDLHQTAPTSAFSKALPGSLVVGTPYTWDYMRRSGLRFGPGVFGLTSTQPSTESTWAAKEALGLAELFEVYGATETAGIGWRSEFHTDFRLLPHLSQDKGELRLLGDDSGCLPIQDNLAWVGADLFRVGKRLDDVIQIAGVNISPRGVENVISSIDGVSNALVSFVEEKLHAVVYLRGNIGQAEEMKNRIGKEIASRLESSARPVVLSFELSETLPEPH